ALVTALITRSYICCMIASFSGALLFFYFFSQAPPGTNLIRSGYAVTFTIILIASLIGGRIALRLAGQAQQSASAAFRTRILFDTNRLLLTAEDYPSIMAVMATQISKLLDREVKIFPVENGVPGEPRILPAQEYAQPELSEDPEKTSRIAGWVIENNMRAGAGTDFFRESPYEFLSVTTGEVCYGVVCVYTGTVSIDPFEHSVLLSIMGECALAIENRYNQEEKERAARKAENEQERANILRSISHDIRTPLTSISGNAANLMSDDGHLDEETKRQMYADIYDDAAWLTGLVENLLSVTRLDNSAIKLNQTAELVEDVIREALKHCSRDLGKHQLQIDVPDDPIIAMMDTHLISQVITNLVNNAVKYTPEGSVIRVSVTSDDSFAYISVADNGEGIADVDKEKVFEMFYSGDNKPMMDSSRSLGLGLALCRTIVKAHGGDIILKDNEPAGSVFTFSLPTFEEKIHE
ncbi:MAG: histidine kinase, partial [Eubacteriaceae bacterium]|nr:histidine kinase [Eubacteriaceae bacterium]